MQVAWVTRCTGFSEPSSSDTEDNFQRGAGSPGADPRLRRRVVLVRTRPTTFGPTPRRWTLRAPGVAAWLPTDQPTRVIGSITTVSRVVFTVGEQSDA